MEVEAVYPHSALLAENFRVAQPPAFWQKAVQLESTNLRHFARLLFQFLLLVQAETSCISPQHSEKVFHNAGNALCKRSAKCSNSLRIYASQRFWLGCLLIKDLGI